LRRDLLVFGLSNQELLKGLKHLMAKERLLQHDFIAHLGEIDSRALHLKMGYSSLFAYCLEELHLSESSALKRIQVARAARKAPQIYRVLEAGKTSLTALSRICPHLKRDNCEDWLSKIEGKSVRQVEELIAKVCPRPDVPDGMKPLSESQVRIQFSADREVAENLGRAVDLLRHKYPEGKYGEIIGAALKLLLEKHDPMCSSAKRSVGRQIGRARPTQATQATQATQIRHRYIPRDMRRKTWERDRGSCSYSGSDGKRCGSTAWLEIDHITPVARGGPSELENLRLLCTFHNQLLAVETFGKTFMKKKRLQAQHSTLPAS